MMKKRMIALVLALIIAFGANIAIGCTAFAEEHVHNYVYKETVKPSCDGDGYEEWICSCGEYEQRNVVEATGHIDLNDDGVCDICEDVYPQYYLKYLLNLFLMFLKRVLGIA